MADEKKESWLNYLALTTVVLAVCATMSTFRGGSYSTRTVISQGKAANQWAYYQSKSIKGYLYELHKDNLELDLKAQHGRLDSSQVNAYDRRIATYDSNITRYDKEMAQIQADARSFETVRDHNQAHAQVFGIAVIYLQIAILLSSIAAVLKKKPVWFVGLVVGIIGIGYFAFAFFIMPA